MNVTHDDKEVIESLGARASTSGQTLIISCAGRQVLVVFHLLYDEVHVRVTHEGRGLECKEKERNTDRPYGEVLCIVLAEQCSLDYLSCYLIL